MDFLHDGARAILKDAGADVDPASKRVRFPRRARRGADRARAARIHAACAQSRAQPRDRRRATSPSARSRARPIPPTATAAAGRATIATTRTSSASGRRFDVIHFWGGYPVEPVDIHASVRHLDALFDMLTLSDKPIHAYSPRPRAQSRRHRDGPDRPRHRRRDAGARAVALHHHQLLLAAAARRADAGGHHPDGAAQPGRRADALHAGRRHGAGDDRRRAGRSRTPRRWPASSLAQIVRPGSPFVYGGFTSNVDMKSGAPAFGTPEYMKTALRRRPARAALRAALPLLQRQRRQHARRAGGL